MLLREKIRMRALAGAGLKIVCCEGECERAGSVFCRLKISKAGPLEPQTIFPSPQGQRPLGSLDYVSRIRLALAVIRPVVLKLRFLVYNALPAAFIIFISPLVQARDLVQAASSAQSLFNKIGVAAVSIGITLGGILFAVGAANIGRMLLISGFVGACAVLGAPAIISLIGKIFGASGL